MIQLKKGDALRIQWQPPLISRIPPGLETVEMEADRIYKIKRCFYIDEKTDGYAAALGETYFSTGSKDIFQIPLTDVLTLEDFLRQLFPEEKYRLIETVVQIHPADQVLSAGLGCPLFQPLLRVEQQVAERGKLICLNRVDLNPEACRLSFPSAPHLI